MGALVLAGCWLENTLVETIFRFLEITAQTCALRLLRGFACCFSNAGFLSCLARVSFSEFLAFSSFLSTRFLRPDEVGTSSHHISTPDQVLYYLTIADDEAMDEAAHAVSESAEINTLPSFFTSTSDSNSGYMELRKSITAGRSKATLPSLLFPRPVTMMSCFENSWKWRLCGRRRISSSSEATAILATEILKLCKSYSVFSSFHRS